MPVSMPPTDPPPAPAGPPTRGISFLIGVLVTLVLLTGGAMLFGGSPSGDIRGPVVDDGSIR